MTELEHIRIESVGRRDLVYLSGTMIRAFVVSCPKEPRPGEKVVVKGQYILGEKFRNRPDREKATIVMEYSHWKERSAPGLFRMVEHSGKYKDGRPLPWHKKPRQSGGAPLNG